MLKSEVAVMPIQGLPESEKIEYLVGSESMLSHAVKLSTRRIFDDMVVDFLSNLSEKLIKDSASKAYPDVKAFAFSIRKAALNKLKEGYDTRRRLGRGIAFHIEPSNVPVNFAVSLSEELLAGNICIFRVSGKDFPEVSLICKEIKGLLNSDFPELSDYICIIRYDRELRRITEYLSSLCDVRVIWGNDSTIADIRSIPLSSRAIELTFSDRDSISVMCSEEVLKADINSLVHDFYQDTYYSDQNACSAPRLIVWVGSDETSKRAAEIFRRGLLDYVRGRYSLPDIAGSDKLLNSCVVAGDQEGSTLFSEDNYLVILRVDELSEGLLDSKGNCGFFFEYLASSLEELLPVFRKSCQTVTYFGIEREKIERLVIENGVRGVDRIVPLGKAMHITNVWDGFDMINMMSRIVGTE